MNLKPGESIGGGLAVAAVVFAIHQNFTPSMADMQGLPAGNTDLDSAERKATWTSAGVVAAISLLAKDPTIFVIGSLATIAMAWMSRNSIHSESTASMISSVPGTVVSANDLSTGPAPATTIPYTMFADTGSEFVSS